jgi:hypothetical protein
MCRWRGDFEWVLIDGCNSAGKVDRISPIALFAISFL